MVSPFVHGVSVPRARGAVRFLSIAIFQIGHVFTLLVLGVASFCLIADTVFSDSILFVFLSGQFVSFGGRICAYDLHVSTRF